jgi:formylglycine-generating enzyme required for sulfatase activity
MPAEVQMKFAWIPPGSFQMGGNGQDSEKPLHTVTLTKGFYLGVTPVTQAQWEWVTGSGNRPSTFTGDDRPVDNVSWNDCQVFCESMRGVTGKPIRLPTEAEWEYACRAGTTTDYYCGTGVEALKKVGWYEGNSNGQTQPVGKKAPNEWGLLDLHGNVWEWCQDWFGAEYYRESDERDPQGPEHGDYRVCRGGSWQNDPGWCRATARGFADATGRHPTYGVRVCFRLD